MGLRNAGFVRAGFRRGNSASGVANTVEFWVATADASVPNAKVLSGITGLVKSTAGTPSAAVGGTDYVVPTGVAGGQTVAGGTAAAENLTLSSTAHATKGQIRFGSSTFFFDEANGRLNLNTGVTGDNRLNIRDGSIGFLGSESFSGSGSGITGNSSTLLFITGGATQATVSSSGLVLRDIALYGSANAAGNLTLGSTTNATKGNILLGSTTVVQDAASSTITSSTARAVHVTTTFAPTSGTGVYRVGELAYTINQTGGANGTVTGLLITATETAVVGTHNLIDAQVGGSSLFTVNNAGNTLIGGATAVASTQFKVRANKTVASAAGAVWDALDVQASTLTVSGSTNITTNVVALSTLRAPTMTSGSALTIDKSATLYIAGKPVAGGSMVLETADGTGTKGSYGLWVEGGANLRGDVIVGDAAGGNVGFFGNGGISLQTITGSRGGNAALASLLTALAAGGYGLIVDSTSA